MKWLLITAYFPPEIGSASFLFYELGKKLVERGHKVTVITGYPSYNVDMRKLPLKYKKGICLKENIDGMKVVRLKTLRLPRYIPIARGIDQFLTAFIFFIGGLFLKKQSFDRVAVYSPPLPLGLAALAISRIKKVQFVLNVQDLFPQSAIDLGILQNRFLIHAFERLETFIYKKADFVTVHSEGNRQHVLSKAVNPAQVLTIPNWIDTDLVRPGDRNNDFRKEFALGDSFIISFAGVIGYSQDLDVVIESASFIKEEDIVFLIVGDGVEKERLQNKVRMKNLKNVIFLPMQPKDKYVELLAASDACLVTLHESVKTPVVPSKLLSIMAAARPVIASLPLEGDAPKIIEESGCGICVKAGASKELADAVKSIHSNRQLGQQYGERGRRYAEDNFSLKKCVSLYETLLPEN